MSLNKKIDKELRKKRRTVLYSMVYASKLSMMAVFLLLLSFIAQPLNQALANGLEEESETEETVIADEVKMDDSDSEENQPEEVESNNQNVSDAENVKENQTDSQDVVQAEVVDIKPVDLTEEEMETNQTTAQVTETEAVSDNENVNTAAEDGEVENEITSTESPVIFEESLENLLINSETLDVLFNGEAASEADLESNLEPDSDIQAVSPVMDDISSTTAEVGGEDLNNGEVLMSASTSAPLATSTSASAGGGSSSSDNQSDDALASTEDAGVDDSGNEQQSSGGGSGGGVADPVNSDREEESAAEEVASSSDSSSSDAKEEGSEENSTTTVERVVESRYLVTDDNYYQFDRKACVAVGDGTYHCSLATENSIDQNSVVYAEAGEDGDMEIFLRTARGGVEQISDNTHEDTSPHIDPESMNIVWQRLIDGRYQVILYNLDEKKEKQLTFSRTNNMEPKVSKEGIVWQAWDGNDWEIMYFDGTYTDQLTDNQAQDVAPVIEDGYVLWSILGSENQEARVYSLEDGETLSIKGHEGGSIANPRFVLVYDTKYENGDIITQRFDPETGLSAPIAAKPAPEPIHIPPVDPIGEIRALIQNKSSQKEDHVENDVENGDSQLDLVSVPADDDDVTLDLKSASSSDLEGVEIAPVAEEEPFILTDYDLVLTETYEELVQSTSSEPVADSAEIVVGAVAESEGVKVELMKEE